MHGDILTGLALIAFLGLMSQWIAWRIQIPSILLLLITGIIAGPITGVLDIDHILGDLLFPIVSLSVAIILFEGGLSLRLADIREVGGVVRNLIVIGAPVTWLVSAVLAYYLLDFGVQLSLLLGAIIVVTGPTVIIPMLKQIRPVARVSSILRWEGILIDPVGAVLAVLVFEEILATGINSGFLHVSWNLIFTVIIGGVGGWVGARIIIELFSRFWVPHSLQIPTTLALVVTMFTISNLLQAESGLVTVTVMGMLLANQSRADLRHVIEFKENLQIILLSVLFVILSARLNLGALQELGMGAVLFVLAVIFLERPIAVFISAIGSDLNWRERLFIAWLAPRGIVAASVSSVFALELAESGFEGAEAIVPMTFAVIIGTVAFYSLTSGRVAQMLGLSQKEPQGILFLGAQSWARMLAKQIHDLGFRVVLADTNQRNIESAQEMGLETYRGNALSDLVLDDVDFSGIGRLIAVTSNEEVNSLATLHFRGTFGEREVYQLPSEAHRDGHENMSSRLIGRHLFGVNTTYTYLTTLFRQRQIECMIVEDAEATQARFGNDLLPLFMKTEDERLEIWTEEYQPRLREGAMLVALAEVATPVEAPRS